MEKEDDGELGILIYGYDRDQAHEIEKFLKGLMGKSVAIFGGSKREGCTIRELTEGPEGENFGIGNTQMLMFLGFDDRGIEAALQAFPRDGTIPRPIFCGPTENNMTWTLSHLLEHLLEEQRYWSEKKKSQP